MLERRKCWRRERHRKAENLGEALDLERSVGEQSCGEVLENRVAEKWWRPSWREVLEKLCKEMLEGSRLDQCWGIGKDLFVICIGVRGLFRFRSLTNSLENFSCVSKIRRNLIFIWHESSVCLLWRQTAISRFRLFEG